MFLRHGKVDLQELLDNGEKDIAAMDEAYKNAKLYKDISNERLQEILTEIRQYNGEGTYIDTKRAILREATG